MQNLGLAADDNRWQTLRLINSIRYILAAAFALLATFTSDDANYQANAELLTALAIGFFVQGFFAGRYLNQPQRLTLRKVGLQLFIDFSLLAVLIVYTKGASNYASLLIIPTIASSLLLPGFRAYVFAALSSLTLLALPLEETLIQQQSNADFTQAGLLGLMLFLIAALGRLVSRLLTASQSRLEKSDINLANLEAASSLVMQNLDSGVVVIDGDNLIQLINNAAVQMLSVRQPLIGRPLSSTSPALHEQITLWRLNPSKQTPAFNIGGRQLVTRLVPVGQMGNAGILVFLDDAEQLSAEAQQNKLVSLGQLTASIAHEIRNPLSAINHASQLLIESPSLDEADAHLSEIVREQVKRVDNIISSVLRLSRKEQSRPTVIGLNKWLADFRNCFILEHQLQAEDFRIELNSENAEVRVDEAHLDQIISNLCRNALHYSKENNASAPLLTIRAEYASTPGCWHIDVIDKGPGIPVTQQSEIFVPFYTTRHEGTGLGLYLARSLCEANGARLVMHDTGEHGTTFRMIFTSPLH